MSQVHVQMGSIAFFGDAFRCTPAPLPRKARAVWTKTFKDSAAAASVLFILTAVVTTMTCELGPFGMSPAGEQAARPVVQ